MADSLNPEERSSLMRRIGSRDTSPEMIVRRYLHGLRYRYRLHASDLPGVPDIVFRRQKTVVFVHGCFWHRHDGCTLAYTPKSRKEFWLAKFEANRTRDKKVRRLLELKGWEVITVWECQTRSGDLDWLPDSLESAFGKGETNE